MSMFEDAMAHARQAIADTRIETQPFEHIYVEKVFPDDFYAALLRNLPDLDGYERLSESGRVHGEYSPERYFIGTLTDRLSHLPAQQKMFWRTFFEHFHKQDFARALVDKFAQCIRQRFIDEGRGGADYNITWSSLLIRDFGQYVLGPHTDSPSKLIASLFYLPPDDSAAHLGTSLYRPTDRNFRCDGTGRHYDFEQFERVQTKAFKPNTLFAFPKSSRCFHGVEPVPERQMRDLLLLDFRHDLGAP